MQVRPETKWKRDQQGKWIRVEKQTPPGVTAPESHPKALQIPGVTYRVRTGITVTALAAKSAFAVIAGGSALNVIRDPKVKPLQFSTPSDVNGLHIGQSTLLVAQAAGKVSELETATGRVRNLSPDLGGIPVGQPAPTS